MKKAEVVDNGNDLTIYVSDDLYPNVKPLDINGEAAYFYLNKFYKEKIEDVIEDEKDIDVTLEYKGCKLVIDNYAKLFENEKYREALMPVFQDVMKFYNKKQELPKQKKVKRVNKHKVRITAAVLTLVMLGSIAKVNSKAPLETISSEDLDLGNNAYAVSDVIEESQDQVIALDTLEMVQKTDEIVSEPEVKEVKEVTNFESFVNDAVQSFNSVVIDYNDRSTSDDANVTRSNYSAVIEKYSNQYGLDSNLILALATQERGVHSEVMDPGGATGLMQIQNSVWDNGSLTAYNFDTASWETITVNIPSLSDLDYNVKVGCMIFQDCLKQNDYNIIAALQSYNMGNGTTYNLIKQYCYDTGKTREEILADQTDVGWLNYRSSIPYGDPHYVENVLSYYGESGTISVVKPDGTICSVSVENEKHRNKAL